MSKELTQSTGFIAHHVGEEICDDPEKRYSFSLLWCTFYNALDELVLEGWEPKFLSKMFVSDKLTHLCNHPHTSFSPSKTLTTQESIFVTVSERSKLLTIAQDETLIPMTTNLIEHFPLLPTAVSSVVCVYLRQYYWPVATTIN